MDNLASFKRHFDPVFLAYLEKKIAQLPSSISLFDELGEELLTFAGPGRRLRPYIAHSASGLPLEALQESPIMQLLCGIELYHLFALVHDDIIDNSDTRHGAKCLHARFGIDNAMLLGDLCLSWAHECIGSIANEVQDSMYVSVIFAALAEETVIGQLFDVALARSIEPTESLLNRSVELKTARYTFIYPIFLGRAVVDVARVEDTLALVRFGRAMGHAFQRLDDLADVFWDENELGKAPCTDFRNGAPTHLSLFVQEYGSAMDRNTCSMLLGNRDASISSIRTLLITSGAYVNEKKAIASLIADARSAIQSLSDSERWEPCIELLEEKFNRL